MNLRNLITPLLCLCFLGLSACDQKQPIAAQTSQATHSLLEEMSGVWRTDGNELITLNVASGRLQMLVDDTFIPVQAGDTDEANQIANLKLRMADGRDVIWTLRKIKDAGSGDDAFRLSLITHEGKVTELGFVRNISADDLSRIVSAEKPQSQQASVLASIVGEPGEPGAADVGSTATLADEAAASAAQAAADAAAAAADTPVAAVEDEAVRRPLLTLTDGDGISYTVSRNGDGIVLESENAVIDVGMSCDAFSPQYGKAAWGWRDGALSIDFGNRQIVLKTPKPEFADASCLD